MVFLQIPREESYEHAGENCCFSVSDKFDTASYGWRSLRPIYPVNLIASSFSMRSSFWSRYLRDHLIENFVALWKGNFVA